MNALFAAIAGCLHPVSAKVPVQVILTSGTSWTVPSDWNNANNKIECLGAARTGGGAYALKNNLALTPGASVTYQIGASSTTQSVADTWFSSVLAVKAVGATGSTGAFSGSCVGDVRYSGGAGGRSGGGAGGPHGDGMPSNESTDTGGAGDAGFGGAGGTSGQPGQPGTEWGSAGSGGGAGRNSTVGGLYGGGASGGGAPGLIVITYTPV